MFVLTKQQKFGQLALMAAKNWTGALQASAPFFFILALLQLVQSLAQPFVSGAMAMFIVHVATIVLTVFLFAGALCSISLSLNKQPASMSHALRYLSSEKVSGYAAVVVTVLVTLLGYYAPVIMHIMPGLFLQHIFVASLLLGGIIAVLLYVLSMILPSAIHGQLSTSQAVSFSIYLTTGQAWRHTAVAFIIVLIAMSSSLLNFPLVHTLRAIHLDWLVSFVVYSTLGLYGLLLATLLVDNAQFAQTS